MSSSLQVPVNVADAGPEVRDSAIGTLLALQGIAASPAELRSAARAWQRLNPQGAAKAPAKASS